MSPSTTVDVPGPLKCSNSPPTMEGHLHGDVRGSGLTPNKQGFGAFRGSPAMQLACVCICNMQNCVQLAPKCRSVNIEGMSGCSLVSDGMLSLVSG